MGTLRPCPEESVNWDTTQNLFIEGDNLEVLKQLQKSYYKKIKMIYIDPPYNTGNDFIYPDNFRDSIKNYMEITGQTDGEGRKLSTNPETSGRFHTDWLNMMYPRLKLARNLLRDDGVIFITIDDNEVANLRKMCDEVLGEENFVANVVWQKKYAVSNDDPGIAPMHDHVLVFRRSESFERNLLPRTEKQTGRYTNPDEDPRGPWSSDNYISNKSRYERPTLWYPIRHPKTGNDVWPEESAVWRYSTEKHQQIEKEGRLFWGPDLSYKRPRLKRFLLEVQDGVVPSTWWPFQELGHNDEGQKETAAIIGPKIFSTPKPIRLIRRMIELGAGADDTIMDFFAGSSASAHAVLELNDQDGGNRKFIMVQLPEPCGKDSEAFRAGYKNIAEIGKERIRRVIKKLNDEDATTTAKETQDPALFSAAGAEESAAPRAPDRGFKVFKLDSSNIKTWDPNFNQLEHTLLSATDKMKPDRTEADVIYEVLLKYGLDLTLPIEKRTIAERTVYIIGGGSLVVCLGMNMTLKIVEQIAALKDEFKPESPPGMRMVFKDNGFANDTLKTNAVQILKQRGIEDVRAL